MDKIDAANDRAIATEVAHSRLQSGRIWSAMCGYTHSQQVLLEPYKTSAIEYYFYFPMTGEFAHYPVDRWQNAFAAMAVQVKEIDDANQRGDAPETVDPDNRDQLLAQLPAGECMFDVAVDKQEVDLPKKKTQFTFQLPAELRNRNVLVEVVGQGKSKRAAYYSNSLNVQTSVIEDRLQACQSTPKTRLTAFTFIAFE
jgi:hypothetical protein